MFGTHSLSCFSVLKIYFVVFGDYDCACHVYALHLHSPCPQLCLIKWDGKCVGVKSWKQQPVVQSFGFTCELTDSVDVALFVVVLRRCYARWLTCFLCVAIVRTYVCTGWWRRETWSNWRRSSCCFVFERRWVIVSVTPFYVVLYIRIAGRRMENDDDTPRRRNCSRSSSCDFSRNQKAVQYYCAKLISLFLLFDNKSAAIKQLSGRH